jgi:CobQ-like glutamine amidotransferase family enzyme
MNNQTPIRVLQLYPDDMNIYGDWGNTLVLKRRLEWRGYDVELLTYNPGGDFPDDIDILVGGGGQDSGQSKIEDDLRMIGPKLKKYAEDGMPMLVICGLYQLFGHYFKTKDGTTIEGIGLLDITTVGGSERLIGNITTESDEFGEIIGYENHSGLTTLGTAVSPLGDVRKGAGNNNADTHEGARYKNVIGTYLHGSLLPKNPAIADYLISTALSRKFGDAFVLKELDDTMEQQARKAAIKRPR